MPAEPVVGKTYVMRSGPIRYERTPLEIIPSVTGQAIGVAYQTGFGLRKRESIEKWNAWQARAEALMEGALARAVGAIHRAIGGDVEIVIRSSTLGGDWVYNSKDCTLGQFHVHFVKDGKI